jgi:phosphoketolase
MLALRFSPLTADAIGRLTARLQAKIDAAVAYTREHFEDPPEIRDWKWEGDRGAL